MINWGGKKKKKKTVWILACHSDVYNYCMVELEDCRKMFRLCFSAL